jgi:DNA polymerase-1
MNPADFREVWCVDFEFRQLPGELPVPICVVATELNSGRWVRLFGDDIPKHAPYSLGEDSLFVAFSASADLLCHIPLGWELPRHVIDLFAEFRVVTNSVDKLDQRASLLSALSFFHIPHIASEQKDQMRALVERGEAEKLSLLRYCESDVVALPALLRKLFDRDRFEQALARGRYAKAVACMEANGIPIDTEMLSELRERWDDIRLDLVSSVDKDSGVFDGIHFRYDRFTHYLEQQRLSWPRTPTGKPCIDDATFKSMALAHPQLNPLRELRATLSSMKLESLSVGRDGRNRTQLKPFSSLASRNQPSTSKFIFGPAVWLRYLIKPKLGNAVAYLDYCQQEFAVAAVLSGDTAMQEAYRSGDPYLKFAVQAGAAPPDATKKSHGAVRDLYKTAALAVMYGMTAKGLSMRVGKSEIDSQRLLNDHRRTYPQFWAWSDKVLDHVQLTGGYSTRSGWRVRRERSRLTDHHKRSLRNFPVQSTGADILRLACCLGIERGIKICAPIHDAVLIEAPARQINAAVATMRAVMAEAGKAVLAGFEVGTEAKVFLDRFEDPRGESTWLLVNELLARTKPRQEQYSLIEVAG